MVQNLILNQISGGNMHRILVGLFFVMLFAGCEEIPAPVSAGSIIVKPLTNIIETTLNPEVSANNLEAVNEDSETLEESSSVVAPEGLYEPALSLPGGKDASKQEIVINKIREITLKKRTKTLDLLEYSASQSQLVGEQVYSRSAIWYENGNNCHEYSIPEIAQMAFLSTGGPKRDALLLDADGDGFACAWIPVR